MKKIIDKIDIQIVEAQGCKNDCTEYYNKTVTKNVPTTGPGGITYPNPACGISNCKSKSKKTPRTTPLW